MKKARFYILLSLASAESYGSAIQEDVRTLSEEAVRLWPATLYGALEDLSREGWIRELGPDEEPEGGAGRERFYRITPEGRAALQDEVERLEGLTRVARTRLGGEGVGA